MNQSFIDSLMHFFSLLFLPLPGKKILKIKEKLEEYIRKAGIAFPVEECLKIYSTYSSKYFIELSGQAYKKEGDSYDIQRHLLHEAGINAQANLYLQERLLVIISLFEFISFYFPEDQLLKDNLLELTKNLNLQNSDYHDAKDFIEGNFGKKPELELVLQEKSLDEELEGEWIKQHQAETKSQQRYLLKEKIKGRLFFRFFNKYNYLAFKYEGTEPLYHNDKITYNTYFYSFRKNDILQFDGLEPITYAEIENQLDELSKPLKIFLSGQNISYRYKNSLFDIKPFSFSEESGQLIGILGNNGVGKSSILKLISNQLKPVEGKVCINGYNLAEYGSRLNPIIGYVPFEDLSEKELSIYENLLFQAELSLGSMPYEEIKGKVKETIIKFQLEDVAYQSLIKNNFQNLTDFQKACFRIAIEMIRNPYILFLDEPLAGLSFADSRRLLSIFKEETYSGKLIFISSYFPAADFYNMFDKIWYIDQDGYLIYSGEPSRSLSFFKDSGLFPYYFIQNRQEIVSPEDVIKIVETKKIQSDGKVSEERLVSPKSWYEAWKNKNKTKIPDKSITGKAIPISGSRLPGIEKQFILYLLRNFRLRFLNFSYLFFHLFIIPLLGISVSIIIKNLYGDHYILGRNEYLPLFLFLSVIIVLFSGLLASVEELYHEKKRIERDISLNISQFSYQNAKVAYLFFLSGLQSFWYVILTNLILGIQGMMIFYFLTYLSVSVFGNILGLILSQSIKRLNVSYILIPFILLPNIIFGGYIIPFDHFKYTGKEEKKIPILAEFIPARYAYEAIMVEQFSKNKYNKYYFEDDKNIYDYNYIYALILPKLEVTLTKAINALDSSSKPDSLSQELELLRNEVEFLGERTEIAPFDKIDLLNLKNFDYRHSNDVYGYLTYIKFLSENLISEYKMNRLKTTNHLLDSLGTLSLDLFKDLHHNQSIEEILTKNKEERILMAENQLIKIGKAVYHNSESKFGRSHFFASEKRIGQHLLPTFRYNLSAIWIMNIILYVLYLTGAVNFLLNFFRFQKN
jgi:ABC-type multidrug transport system ATPase subunit